MISNITIADAGMYVCGIPGSEYEFHVFVTPGEQTLYFRGFV